MNRVISFVTLITLASCAAVPYRPYAREVKKKPGVEGVISLKPDYVPEDRIAADSLMGKNCGENTVNILEEGEVVIGSSTSRNTKAVQDKQQASAFNLGGGNFLSGHKADVTDTESSTKTVAVKEWQIRYKCKSLLTKTSPVGKSSKALKTSRATSTTPVVIIK